MAYQGPAGEERYNVREQWTEVIPDEGDEYRYRDVGYRVLLEFRSGPSFDWLPSGVFKDMDDIYNYIDEERKRHE